MMNFMLDEERYVALIGLPGCGKSTFAQLLAKEMNLTAIDSDETIVETSGKTIPELFAESEDLFRDWEEKVLASIRPDRNLVVACGGGIVKRETCRDILKRNAIVIYIDRSPENICATIDTSGRPLLADGTDVIFRLHEERKALYEETADVVIPNNGSIAEALQQMTDALFMLL